MSDFIPHFIRHHLSMRRSVLIHVAERAPRSLQMVILQMSFREVVNSLIVCLWQRVTSMFLKDIPRYYHLISNTYYTPRWPLLHCGNSEMNILYPHIIQFNCCFSDNAEQERQGRWVASADRTENPYWAHPGRCHQIIIAYNQRL